MKCRSCGNNLEVPFLSLGNSPLANSYVRKENLFDIEQYYPLDIFICKNCYLVQIDKFIPELVIFSPDYAYFSSYSTTMLRHCKNYVDMMMKRFNYNKDSFIIEIGSNDGYLLQYFKEHNNSIPILGIEPAADAAKMAIDKGIHTDITFFNIDYAQKMKNKADLIIGNNVLAHNPDLNNFVEGLRKVLKSEGIITIEVPFLLELIRNNEFDTLYHEHFNYFSFFSLRKLFSDHQLEIFDVEEIAIHGGSIRIYVKHRDNIHINNSNNVSKLIRKETELYVTKTYIDFVDRIRQIKRDTLKILIDIKNQNKKIVGYGAPAKGNTFLNYCGIRHDDGLIEYVVDMNPAKQGKYLPGSHIPILHPDKIKEDRPDYILILPWNIKEEIMSQLEYVKEWGCKFIISIPNPIII